VIYFKDNKTLLLIILFICSKEYEKRLLKEWENSDKNYHLIEYQWTKKYLNWLWDTKDYSNFRLPVPNSKLFKNNILISGLLKDKDY